MQKYSECVCVFSQKSSMGTSVGFTPGNWAYISHRAYARLFKVAKTMQNELSIDPRGTLVAYNAPARFTYWVPTCVWMIAGTIQMGKIKTKINTSPVVVYAPLLSIKSQFLLTKLYLDLKFD